MSSSLKSELWIQAQIRTCDVHFMQAVVVRRGDPDAGAIFLVLDHRQKGCDILAGARTIDGERAWIKAGVKTGISPGPDTDKRLSQQDADAYLKRQISRDPDIWILEIDDPNETYEPDAPII